MSPLLVALVVLIRTYDGFGLPAGDFDIARRAANEAMRTAGLEAAWTVCRAFDATPEQNPSTCSAGLAVNELMVRIVANAGFADDRTLGYSFVDTKAEGGVLATIDAARVMLLAARAGIEPALLLGWAVAHEIGHLLLGTSSHAPHGLMRARWSLDELRRTNVIDWAFSRADRQKIQARLRRLDGGAYAADVPGPPSADTRH